MHEVVLSSPRWNFKHLAIRIFSSFIAHSSASVYSWPCFVFQRLNNNKSWQIILQHLWLDNLCKGNYNKSTYIQGFDIFNAGWDKYGAFLINVSLNRSSSSFFRFCNWKTGSHRIKEPDTAKPSWTLPPRYTCTHE